MIAATGPFLLRAQEEEFDPDLVTPGVVGFIATFLVMVVVVLLILDMVRRIRRVNYRAEVRQQLEAERLEAEFAANGGADGGEGTATAPDATTATSEGERPAASDDEGEAPTRR